MVQVISLGFHNNKDEGTFVGIIMGQHIVVPFISWSSNNKAFVLVKRVQIKFAEMNTEP